MFIRYEQTSGNISGIFPADYWTNHVPDGHAYIELVLDESQSLMESPESYVVRDDGGGPALYERSE